MGFTRRYIFESVSILELDTTGDIITHTVTIKSAHGISSAIVIVVYTIAKGGL